MQSFFFAVALKVETAQCFDFDYSNSVEISQRLASHHSALYKYTALTFPIILD
jgi:hypothetical protein